MSPSDQEVPLLLLVAREQTREYLVHFLKENNYAPLVKTDPMELVQALKGQRQATVFVDCEAVPLYGAGIYSRIKVACPLCRVVLLCDKNHAGHRDIIQQAMGIGVYACLLAPFEGWEILTMVRHTGGRKTAGRRRLPRKASPS